MTLSIDCGHGIPMDLLCGACEEQQMQQPETLEATLLQRGSRYGPFAGHAKIVQDLKKIMHDSVGWDDLTPAQKESLEMIQHKVGRILNGDPNYDDSWVDIAGYAELVVKECRAASLLQNVSLGQ